ncbi:MAG TPA: hypothetical protein VK470_07245 [Bacteroidota bacterium]|nr:hypothetical protein [Bacteroidota bacterium]
MTTRLALVILMLLPFSLLAQGELPPTDSSRAVIAELTPRLAALDSSLNAAFSAIDRGPEDLIVTVKSGVIEALFGALAARGTDDCLVTLQPTKGIWTDKKSLFGISVNSSLDVDSGRIGIDLKQFTVPSMMKNIIESDIELEGAGRISVSGQSAGIPGRASPVLALYLHDRVRFACSGDRTGTITLRPQEATVILKAKLTVKLWGFDLPYYREIPIAVSDVIPALVLPIALSSSVNAPIRGSYQHGRVIEYTSYSVTFGSLRIWADRGAIELRTNLTIH